MKGSRGGNLLAVLAAVVGLLILIPGLSPAAPAAKAKRRIITVTMSKGQTYVIEGVSTNGAPGVKVVHNPNALVVRTDAPGKVVLVGADAGSWSLDLTLASGEEVTYKVTVNADAPPQGSLAPGSAPTAIP
jgi:hypothetical protein